jgi:hypothetical protein
LSSACARTAKRLCSRSRAWAARALRPGAPSSTISSSAGCGGPKASVIWRETLMGRYFWKQEDNSFATPAHVIWSNVRFAGKGFMALTAGAEAPYRMNYGRAGSRALFSLHRNTDTAKSGELGVMSYRAGIQAYGWAVVTAGACGEQVLSQGKQTVETVPGAAQLVIQDRYSTEKPKQRILSRAKTHELLIFPGRYEVHEIATGAKIIDRPGIDPNFSPTGRFVGARATNEGKLEIFDLVSGTRVRNYYPDYFLAWARRDSFIAAGGSMYGSVYLDNAIVDQDEILEAAVGYRIYNAWDKAQVILDTDRGFVAAVGEREVVIVDLFTREGTSSFAQGISPQTQISDFELRFIPCGQKIKTAGKTRGYPIPA